MTKEEAMKLKEKLLKNAKRIKNKINNEKYGPKDYYKGKLEGLLYAVDMLCIYADILEYGEYLHEYKEALK